MYLIPNYQVTQTCADSVECQCKSAEIAHLQDEIAGLRTAMESRAAIEQAKGVIMAQRRCDAQQAFHYLVLASQRSNRKLRDIAEEIVHGCSCAVKSPMPAVG